LDLKNRHEDNYDKYFDVYLEGLRILVGKEKNNPVPKRIQGFYLFQIFKLIVATYDPAEIEFVQLIQN